VAVVLVTIAVVLAVSGGFRTTVGGFRISARSPLAASIAALFAGAAWFALARRDRAIAADLEAAWRAIERNASRLIGVVALIAAIVASTFATRSAAGADASGYLSEATMFAKGAQFHFEPLAIELADLEGWLATPLGWRPSKVLALQAPTYPPGLPLLMALPHAVAGINGATAVVIASTTIAVWATGMIAGGSAGIVAAILIAFSPVFLYQSLQPMSDVPVTAAWMACFLLARHDRRSLGAGAACAIAIVIRPNLAPLAMVPFFIVPRRLAFALPVLTAGAFVAFMQWLWYGSPLQSGYGSAGELFSMSNITPNAGRYFNWLIATAPVMFLALFGFARLRRDGDARTLGIFALLVIASYLVYAVFDHWSYLRFLLPAMAVFAIFAAIEIVAWVQRWPVAARFPIFLVLLLGVVAHSLFVARTLDTFMLRDQLRRIEQTAQFVNQTSPADAVLIAGEQSGSMRYYTGRPILRWEAATPEQLSGAITTLAPRPLYVVLDAWENETFLAKFKDVPAVALDWPPVSDAGTSHRTRVWNLADRARFLAGENLRTARLP
jgi:hypothetical protein